MDIPDCIWMEICRFLQAKELCRMALLNKHFSFVASNNYAWKIIIMKKISKEPKCIENFKKSLAEINFMATRIITEYQYETHNLEIILDRERKRQNKALELKRLERQLNRVLRNN
jgi:hypothetical protein